eukprot:1473117-Rhodomonas_salina.1
MQQLDASSSLAFIDNTTRLGISDFEPVCRNPVGDSCPGCNETITSPAGWQGTYVLLNFTRYSAFGTVLGDPSVHYSSFEIEIQGKCVSDVCAFAGTGIAGYVDGSSDLATSATSAAFHAPSSLLMSPDKSFLYVVDTENNAIRALKLANMEVVTDVAGSFGDLDGCNTSAQFSHMSHAIMDPAGEFMYVSEYGVHRIRSVRVSTMCTATVAGSSDGYTDGVGTTSQFSNPRGLALSANGEILYVADSENHRIRAVLLANNTVTTLVGDGSMGLRDGFGTSAAITRPWGLVMSPSRNYLYVSTYGEFMLRRVDVTTGYIKTIAGRSQGAWSGEGLHAQFGYQFLDQAVWSPDGTIMFFTDRGMNAIRYLNTVQDFVGTLAGAPDVAGSFVDGDSTSARFDGPWGLALAPDNFTFFVSDFSGHRIRTISMRTPAPRFTIPTGQYTLTTEQSIVLSAWSREGAAVHYTVDGSIPTTASPQMQTSIVWENVCSGCTAEATKERLGIMTLDHCKTLCLANRICTSIDWGKQARNHDELAVCWLNLVGESDHWSQTSRTFPAFSANAIDSTTEVYPWCAQGGLIETTASDEYGVWAPTLCSSTTLPRFNAGTHIIRAVAKHAIFPLSLVSYLELVVREPAVSELAVVHHGNSAQRSRDIELSLPGGIAELFTGYDLLVSDRTHHTLFRIDRRTGQILMQIGDTFNGVGVQDGNFAENVTFAHPSVIAASTKSLVAFVVDQASDTSVGGACVRKVDLSGTTKVTTLAGSKSGSTGHTDGDGASALFDGILGIVYFHDVSGGVLYLTESQSHTVRSINASNGYVGTVAGVAYSAGEIDGDASTARLSFPQDIVVSPDGARLFLTEQTTNAIRVVYVKDGSVLTLHPAPTASVLLQTGMSLVLVRNDTLYLGDEAARKLHEFFISANMTFQDVVSYDIGASSSSTVSQSALCANGSAVCIALGPAPTIYSVNIGRTPAPTIFHPPAGRYFVPSTGTFFPTVFIHGLNDDAVVTYTTDGSTPTSASLAYDRFTGIPVPGFGAFLVKVQATELGLQSSYVTEASYSILPQEVSTIAGDVEGTAGSADGFGTYAGFSDPSATVLSQDQSTLYVADSGNHRIRQINMSTWLVTTTAGFDQGDIDGEGTSAMFNNPRGLALSTDGLHLYVADTDNHKIRVIELSSGNVSVLAGSTAGNMDGNGTFAMFNGPHGLAVSSNGATLYVCDTYNHLVRTINLTGSTRGGVATLVGGGANTARDANFGTQIGFSLPYGVSVVASTGSGYYPSLGESLFVLDSDSVRSIRIGAVGPDQIEIGLVRSLQNSDDVIATDCAAGDFTCKSGCMARTELSGARDIVVTAEGEVAYTVDTTGVRAVSKRGVCHIAGGSDLRSPIIDSWDRECGRFGATKAGGLTLTSDEQIVFVADSTNNKIRAAVVDINFESCFEGQNCPYCGDGGVNLAGTGPSWEPCDVAFGSSLEGCTNYCRVQPGYKCSWDFVVYDERCPPATEQSVSPVSFMVASIDVCLSRCDATLDCEFVSYKLSSQECRLHTYQCGTSNLVAATGFETWKRANVTTEACTSVCGDGIRLNAYEECDDQNLVDGDGCSSNCTIEVGWQCDGGDLVSMDHCIPICGDGLYRGYEFEETNCDDGNFIRYDGCSPECTVEVPHPTEFSIARVSRHVAVMKWNHTDLALSAEAAFAVWAPQGDFTPGWPLVPIIPFPEAQYDYWQLPASARGLDARHRVLSYLVTVNKTLCRPWWAECITSIHVTELAYDNCGTPGDGCCNTSCTLHIERLESGVHMTVHLEGVNVQGIGNETVYYDRWTTLPSFDVAMTYDETIAGPHNDADEIILGWNVPSDTGWGDTISLPVLGFRLQASLCEFWTSFEVCGPLWEETFYPEMISNTSTFEYPISINVSFVLDLGFFYYYSLNPFNKLGFSNTSHIIWKQYGALRFAEPFIDLPATFPVQTAVTDVAHVWVARSFTETMLIHISGLPFLRNETYISVTLAQGNSSAEAQFKLLESAIFEGALLEVTPPAFDQDLIEACPQPCYYTLTITVLRWPVKTVTGLYRYFTYPRAVVKSVLPSRGPIFGGNAVTVRMTDFSGPQTREGAGLINLVSVFEGSLILEIAYKISGVESERVRPSVRLPLAPEIIDGENTFDFAMTVPESPRKDGAATLILYLNGTEFTRIDQTEQALDFEYIGVRVTGIVPAAGLLNPGSGGLTLYIEIANLQDRSNITIMVGTQAYSRACPLLSPLETTGVEFGVLTTGICRAPELPQTLIGTINVTVVPIVEEAIPVPWEYLPPPDVELVSSSVEFLDTNQFWVPAGERQREGSILLKNLSPLYGYQFDGFSILFGSVLGEITGSLQLPKDTLLSFKTPARTVPSVDIPVTVVTSYQGAVAERYTLLDDGSTFLVEFRDMTFPRIAASAPRVGRKMGGEILRLGVVYLPQDITLDEVVVKFHYTTGNVTQAIVNGIISIAKWRLAGMEYNAHINIYPITVWFAGLNPALNKLYTLAPEDTWFASQQFAINAALALDQAFVIDISVPAHPFPRGTGNNVAEVTLEVRGVTLRQNYRYADEFRGPARAVATGEKTSLISSVNGGDFFTVVLTGFSIVYKSTDITVLFGTERVPVFRIVESTSTRTEIILISPPSGLGRVTVTMYPTRLPANSASFSLLYVFDKPLITTFLPYLHYTAGGSVLTMSVLGIDHIDLTPTNFGVTVQ